MQSLGAGISPLKKSASTRATFIEQDDDDELEEENYKFDWSNIIFIPFNSVFKLVLIVAVISKTIVGPMRSVVPELYCDIPVNGTGVEFFSSVKTFISYVCDPIYVIDTFLHIIHKQVEDKAKQREYLPKSSLTILVDIFSLLPLYRLVATVDCGRVALWPNILNFNDFLVIYRLIQAFHMNKTHSLLMNIVASFIIGVICVNAITCFWLLLTYQGFCHECHTKLLDWRLVIEDRLNRLQSDGERFFFQYFALIGYFTSIILQTTVNNIRPMLLLEIILTNIVVAFSYFTVAFAVLPKLFNECCLRHSEMFRFTRNVRRVKQDNMRRCQSSEFNKTIDSYYHYIWTKRSGITKIPEVILKLPRYLSSEIKEDLCWPLFYHSPLFRRTSVSFKRWICDYIDFEYKMPSNHFFRDAQCSGNLYYIKSGIVQLISSDDGVTPLLSVSGGTIFGDINFFVPALYRKVTVRCLTYCEVYSLPRKHIYAAMAKFPKDRAMIMYKVRQRLSHARDLNILKQASLHNDRIETENLIWLKLRWWNISDVIKNARQKASTITNLISFDIPAEDTIYHCSKYIGQLVLCDDTQLQSKSTFVTAKFPWIFVPDSTFSITWHWIVKCTVYMVLVLYPPLLVNTAQVSWFPVFDAWIDFVYISDTLLSLLTAPQENDETTSFSVVMFTRCKDPIFLFDILATPLLDELVKLSGLANFANLFKFNRLIKIYVIFKTSFVTTADLNSSPIWKVSGRKTWLYFAYSYITCFFIYILCFKFQVLSHVAFFCFVPEKNYNYSHLFIYLSWVRESPIHFKCLPDTYHEIYVITGVAMFGFMIKTHTKAYMIGAFYLKNIEYIKYQFCIKQLLTQFKSVNVHPSLIKRLLKYLSCHWKAYDGHDLRSHGLVDGAPADIYWKVHGEMATKVIRESQICLGASEEMIKEIARRATFSIYPKNAVLYLYGCPFERVSWLIQGHLTCVHPNEKGKMVKLEMNKGELISAIAVFFDKFSIRTFITASNVEILSLKKRHFYEILRRYPTEQKIFNNCVEDIRPAFETIYLRHIRDVKFEFQRAIRQRIYTLDKNLVNHASVLKGHDEIKHTSTLQFILKYRFWIHPLSKYYGTFIKLRALLIYATIIVSAAEAGPGAFKFRILWQVYKLNGYITYIDMVLKMFLTYYNEDGILIYDWKMRIRYYLGHSFVADLWGAIDWYSVVMHLIPKAMNNMQALFFSTLCICSHLYLVIGYLNDLAYRPHANMVIIMIVKWHLLFVIVIVVAAQFFMTSCMEITWTKERELIDIIYRNETCWISSWSYPSRPNLNGRNLTIEEVRELYAESLLLSTYGFMHTLIGRLPFKVLGNYYLLLISAIVGVIYWFTMTYIVSLLVLNSRGMNEFLDGIAQLETFMKGERIEASFIKTVTEHYKYVWLRTQGVSIRTRKMYAVGLILRQDLSYFFYKGTLGLTDQQLHFGSSLKWHLAFYCEPLYFLEGADIMRENDFVENIYIIQRGAVTIFQNNRRLASLEQGSIFGQLEQGKARPIKVTAKARDNTDVLTIPWKKFQALVSNRCREHMKKERTFLNDYISVNVSAKLNPYNTLTYILRGSKTISYPWMKNSSCNIKTSSWYAFWLTLLWLVEPFVSISISLLTVLFLPYRVKISLVYILIVTDCLAFIQIASDYVYGRDLVVHSGVAIYRTTKLRKLKRIGLYVDILSVLIPNIAIFFDIRWLQLARALRIRNFYLFYKQFFQSSTKPTVLYFLCIVLFVHTLVCMYIAFACETDGGAFYLPTYPEDLLNKSYDTSEWTLSTKRRKGCGIIVKHEWHNTTGHWVMQTKNWYGDYLLSLSNIVQITSLFAFISDLGYYHGLSILLVKALINFCLTSIDILIVSKAISMISIKYRKLYKYHKMVKELMIFLAAEGLSPTLMEIVNTYMSQLWDRQRGNWLPELAYQAPQCLRQDIMCTLYIHHLHKPHIFRDIPEHFLRQLVSKFHRVVIFPGKYLVRAGDVLPRLYFIHEGDIEKHYINNQGEVVTTHLLTTNGYFGFVPGMPADMPFACSYYTRTVVDVVYIQIEDWNDLLEIYGDVKTYLYKMADSVTHEL